MGIKLQLSKYANKIYDQLWFKNGGPANIHIVNLDFDCEKSEYLKNILFGNPGATYFDGLHLRGRSGRRHFTYRAVQAIKPVFSLHPPFAGDYYMQDEQDQLQSQMDSRGGNTEQYPKEIRS